VVRVEAMAYGADLVSKWAGGPLAGCSTTLQACFALVVPLVGAHLHSQPGDASWRFLHAPAAGPQHRSRRNCACAKHTGASAASAAAAAAHCPALQCRRICSWASAHPSCCGHRWVLQIRTSCCTAPSAHERHGNCCPVLHRLHAALLPQRRDCQSWRCGADGEWSQLSVAEPALPDCPPAQKSSVRAASALLRLRLRSAEHAVQWARTARHRISMPVTIHSLPDSRALSTPSQCTPPITRSLQ
jgi:hypothetical protein